MIPESVHAREASERAEAAQVLEKLGCDANLALAHRTRRAVRDASIAMEEQRAGLRRSRGLAIAAVCSMLVLVAPALWNSVEVVSGDEYLADLSVQVAVLLLVSIPAILGALIALWKGRYDAREETIRCVRR